jgi:hypothetical protein
MGSRGSRGSRGRKPCFLVLVRLGIYYFIKNIHLKGMGNRE